jgi:hypothetical protein
MGLPNKVFELGECIHDCELLSLDVTILVLFLGNEVFILEVKEESEGASGLDRERATLDTTEEQFFCGSLPVWFEALPK